MWGNMLWVLYPSCERTVELFTQTPASRSCQPSPEDRTEQVSHAQRGCEWQGDRHTKCQRNRERHIGVWKIAEPVRETKNGKGIQIQSRTVREHRLELAKGLEMDREMVAARRQ